jgi:hypothetical protein
LPAQVLPHVGEICGCRPAQLSGGTFAKQRAQFRSDSSHVSLPLRRDGRKREKLLKAGSCARSLNRREFGKRLPVTLCRRNERPSRSCRQWTARGAALGHPNLNYLLNEWDPIGVADLMPDAYHSGRNLIRGQRNPARRSPCGQGRGARGKIHGVNDERPGYVKVRFRLKQDEDGWPPAGSEGLWAVPLGGDVFRIDNTPWFAQDVAADDEFHAAPDADGLLWAGERLRWSGNCTIRVIPFAGGALAGSQQAVLDLFIPMGATGEGYGSTLNIVALTVPPTADIPAIKQALQRGQADGSWAYEEGCIADEWTSA